MNSPTTAHGVGTSSTQSGTNDRHHRRLAEVEAVGGERRGVHALVVAAVEAAEQARVDASAGAPSRRYASCADDHQRQARPRTRAAPRMRRLPARAASPRAPAGRWTSADGGEDRDRADRDQELESPIVALAASPSRIFRPRNDGASSTHSAEPDADGEDGVTGDVGPDAELPMQPTSRGDVGEIASMCWLSVRMRSPETCAAAGARSRRGRKSLFVSGISQGFPDSARRFACAATALA